MNVNFYKTYFEIEKNHWLMKVRRGIALDSFDKSSIKNTENTRVLDFGCGSGYFIGELQNKIPNSYGIDMSDEAIDFGKSKGVKNLSVLKENKIDFPNNYFDYVFSMDVLEHLEDEKWAIEEISRVLKVNGKFVIMVPAYMFLWGVQDEVAHHYRRYTLKKLTKLVMKNGNFQIKKSSYFNTFLFLPIALIRIISRIFNLKKRQSDFDINNPLMDKIFFTIFDFERKLLKNIKFPFGVSILLILEKKV